MRCFNKHYLLAMVFSAVLAEFFIISPVFALSNEAVELNRKGVVALESGRFGDAVQYLKQAMSLEPSWGEPCYNAARLLRIGGKREEMIKMMRKANGVEPSNKLYANKYLEVLHEELDKAEKESNSEKIENLQNEIQRVDPGNLGLGLKRIKKLIELGEKTEALELCKDVLAKNSNNRSNYELKEMGELYLCAAKIALDLGDYNSAKSYADNSKKFEFPKKKEAEQLASQIKNTVNEKVAILVEDSNEAQKRGNYDKAKSLLKEAEKYDIDNKAIRSANAKLDESEEISKFLAKANSYNSSNRWLDAREVLHKLLDKYPDCEKAQKMMKEIGAKEAALSKAVGLPDIPLSLDGRKKSIENIIRGAIVLFDKENFKRAVEQFNKALAFIEADEGLSSYKDEIDKYLGKVADMDENSSNWTKALDARNSGDYEDVLKYLKKLPEDYNIQMDSYWAEAYYKTGDLEKARKYGISQLNKQNENNRAKFVLGCIALDSNELDVAYKYFTEIYESDPDYPEVGDKLALASQKHLPKVVAIIIVILLCWIGLTVKKNLPIYRKNGLIQKGRQCFNREDWDGCIEVLLKVRRSAYLTNVDIFEISKLFAQSYLKKGRYDLAIGECKHLISLSPKTEEPHTWLGYAYLGRRMLSPEALPELLNLYKKESRNIALVSLLGSYYAQQKNLSDEGVAILEQWLNLDYDNVDVLKPLGKYYLKKNRSDDKAMKVFSKMMEIGSPDPDFMLGVANAHLKARRFEECLDLCQKVIENDPNNSLVHSVLLDAYKMMNKLPELLEIYSNTLKEIPYNVAFQNGLKEAQIAYTKLQERNARQAAAEAAAVMQKMNFEPESVDVPETVENPEAGQIACPSCGNGNPEGAYCCQHCGANLFQ